MGFAGNVTGDPLDCETIAVLAGLTSDRLGLVPPTLVGRDYRSDFSRSAPMQGGVNLPSNSGALRQIPDRGLAGNLFSVPAGKIFARATVNSSAGARIVLDRRSSPRIWCQRF